MKKINLDLIIPFKNEKKNLELFFIQFKKKLKIFKKNKININLIFIDDFSSDNSSEVVRENSKIFKNILHIKNIENYGSHFSSLLGLKYSKGDISLFLWSDLEFSLNKVFNLVKVYRKYKKPIVISYNNKHKFFENLFPLIFWKLFSLFYLVNIKNFFTILIDRKNSKKVSKELKITDLIFIRIFKVIKNFLIFETKLIERKYGETKWTLYKKILLIYNTLIFNSNFIKILIIFFSLFLISINIIFIIILILFVIFEIKMTILKNKKVKFKIKKFK